MSQELQIQRLKLKHQRKKLLLRQPKSRHLPMQRKEPVKRPRSKQLRLRLKLPRLRLKQLRLRLKRPRLRLKLPRLRLKPPRLRLKLPRLRLKQPRPKRRPNGRPTRIPSPTTPLLNLR